jgi:hypothetical protein
LASLARIESPGGAAACVAAVERFAPAERVPPAARFVALERAAPAERLAPLERVPPAARFVALEPVAPAELVAREERPVAAERELRAAELLFDRAWRFVAGLLFAGLRSPLPFAGLLRVREVLFSVLLSVATGPSLIG